MPSPPIHIGVLLLPPIQLLDIASVDLFGMLSPSYLTAVPLPQPLKNGVIPLTITYISPLGPNTYAGCTASANILVNAALDDPSVAPGKLDILLIPGPDPGAETEERVKEWIRGHVDEESVTLMTVCTGCYPAARAGVLKGRKASGPRALVPELQKEFPETQWDGERRWVRDGRVWSSGGITNGHDMVAAYMRERWPGPTTEAVLAMADVGERGAEYGSSQASNNVWWLWQIFRGWMIGGKN